MRKIIESRLEELRVQAERLEKKIDYLGQDHFEKYIGKKEQAYIDGELKTYMKRETLYHCSEKNMYVEYLDSDLHEARDEFSRVWAKIDELESLLEMVEDDC